MKSVKKSNKKGVAKTRLPLVSIVMPVFNASKFLSESVESILNQTYKNLEFIIVDDASKDNSYQILKYYRKKDKRIRLLRNKTNLGISQTMQKAIAKTKGSIIARMDADDISLPERIEKQVKFLIKNKNTVAVGGQCVLINKDGMIIGKKTFPTQFKQIYQHLFEFATVQQPTIMIYKTRLPKDFQFYRNGMNTAEELELFFKLFEHGKVENLSEAVLMYRIHDNNTSLKDVKKTFTLTLVSRILAILQYNYKPTFRGVLTTLLQSFLVFVLPQDKILSLYQFAKKITFNKTPALSRSTSLSVKALMAKA